MATITHDDEGIQTGIVRLLDRDIVIKKPNDAQIALLAQQSRIASGDDPARRMRAVALIMDIIENLIAESDRDFVQNNMIAGKLDLKQIVGLLTTHGEETSAKPAAVRRARR